MSSALEAPPAAARFATHLMGRDARAMGLFLLFPFCLMPIYFAAPGIVWAAIPLIGLAALVNLSRSRCNMVLAAVCVRPPLAQRLQQVKLS